MSREKGLCNAQSLRAGRAAVLLSLTAALTDARGAAPEACLDEEPLYPRGAAYAQVIPEPRAFLGHALGDEPIHPYRLTAYLEHLANASDRVTIRTVGRSHERHPILLLTITSPGNHARLDRLRQDHLASADPGAGAEISGERPVFIWLNYGVHGSESSGLDAVLPTVYHLAAADSPAVERLLETSVILVNPIANPDGHAQRVAWLDAYGSELNRANPDHLEHKYSGARTRTNHYGFDLNRQWLFAAQPEARAWVGEWHRWRPNLTLDYHEMGSKRTYYFHPGVETRVNPLIPEGARQLMVRTVKRSEDYFDTNGLLYFHGAGYDNFFIGKGSTFPMINGGVGVLYEAGMSRGRFLETGNGCRNYRDNIRKHFRTALTSIESAVELRTDFFRYQRSFFESALDESRSHDVKAYVVSADTDRELLRRFYELLALHRIEARSLSRPVEAGGRTYEPADSMLVPLEQPQHRLVRSIFETPVEFEDPGFYDVSTWTLPPAYGLRYTALDARELDAVHVAGAYTHVPALPPPVDESAYAYVIEWERYLAPRAVYAALERGLLAKVATEAFAATTPDGPREFPAGSILISTEGQPLDRAGIASLVAGLNGLEGIAIHSLRSGKSATGNAGVDAGAPSFRPLELPEILLVVGSGISWFNAGETWHLLDKDMRIPVTLMSKSKLDDSDLDRYTHIVFSGGRYSRSRKLTKRLRAWVENGGTVIGLRQAAPWLQSGLLDDLVESADKEDDVNDDTEREAYRRDYGTRKTHAATEKISGAIFAADLDTSHPLGFGYSGRTISLHKSTTAVLDSMQNPYATVLQYTSEPLVSGFASGENLTAIAGTPALVAERLGDGSVILFADNPNFRGYWYGTAKLFFNSLFFSKAFDHID